MGVAQSSDPTIHESCAYLDTEKIRDHLSTGYDATSFEDQEWTDYPYGYNATMKRCGLLDSVMGASLKNFNQTYRSSSPRDVDTLNVADIYSSDTEGSCSPVRNLEAAEAIQGSNQASKNFSKINQKMNADDSCLPDGVEGKPNDACANITQAQKFVLKRREAFDLLVANGAKPTIYHHIRLGGYLDVIDMIDKQRDFSAIDLPYISVPACIVQHACYHANQSAIVKLSDLAKHEMSTDDIIKCYDIACALPPIIAQACLAALSILARSKDTSIQLYHYIRAQDLTSLHRVLALDPSRATTEKAKYGQQLLHYTLQYGCIESFDLLLNYNAPLTSRGLCDEPLFHCAVKKCTPAMFSVLLNYLDKTNMEWIALEEHYDVSVTSLISPEIYAILFKYPGKTVVVIAVTNKCLISAS